jgi:cyclophilin family peptidyl-prolyl cis-trans isomerase
VRGERGWGPASAEKEDAMLKTLAIAALAITVTGLTTRAAQRKSPGAGPIIVLETAKGTIEFETYPEEAPKTVARIVELVKKGFYNGQRFHREDDLAIQIGDPTTRDMTKVDSWGRFGSGSPIGVAEITRKRRKTLGAVGLGHTGDPREADSQFYILKRAAPSLDVKYAVFGHVLSGMDVVAKIRKGDVLKRAYLKE